MRYCERCWKKPDACECDPLQGDLLAQPYNGTPPFEKSSATSRAAAESVKAKAPSKRTVVYEKIRASDGLTDDQLEALTGWRHQTVSARRRELVLLGKVRDAKRLRRTSSGRMATVWVAT